MVSPEKKKKQQLNRGTTIMIYLIFILSNKLFAHLDQELLNGKPT
jgi:hypothetical protein